MKQRTVLRENDISLGIMLRNPIPDALFLTLDEVRRRENAVYNDGLDTLLLDQATLLHNLLFNDITYQVAVDFNAAVHIATISTDDIGQVAWPVDAGVAFARKGAAEADDGNWGETIAVLFDDGVDEVLRQRL
jgi:hypothetical protein